MAWVPSSTIRSGDEGWISGWRNTETGEFSTTQPSGALTENQANQQSWDSLSGDPQSRINQSLDKGYGSLANWAQQQGLVSLQDLYSNPRYVMAAQDAQRRMADRNAWETGFDIGFPIFAGAMLTGGTLAGLDAIGGGTAGATAGGAGGAEGAAAGGTAMPAAIPEADPTFGGALTQTSPGVYTAGGGGALMPAAIPEADPTFGGELTQTAPGGFENLANTTEFGGGLSPANVAGGGALAASALGASSGGGSGGSSGGSGGSGTSGGGGSGSDGFFGLQDDEWLRRLSYGIPGILGAIGAGSQAEDYEDLAHQYQQMGAPYRSRLEQLYGNPEAFLNSPEVRQPIQQGTDMLARSLSVKGNPAGSGNALQELQNYASTQLFNRLGQEKDRLGGFGGLTQYNQAAPQAASNVIGAQGNIYSNLGGAAADIFNPPRRYTLQDLMRQY